MSLDLARSALERGEYEEALPLLLAQWRRLRAPSLGELIDRVDRRVLAEPFTGGSQHWLAAAAHSTDLTRGPLIRAIASPGSFRTLLETEEWIAHAVAWDDPRLTTAIRALLVGLPWTGLTSRDGWRVIFDAIGRHRDPRLFELAQTLPPTWTVGAAMQRYLTSLVKAAVKPVPSTELPEAAALLSLVPDAAPPKAKPVTETNLLARIYEDPFNDAPRAVYADWLLERDDPRGELIALQLRADKDEAALATEAALLKKHRKAWEAPLSEVLRGIEWRRGFPARGTVKFRHQRDVDQHGHYPAWATIEDLGWEHSQARDDRLEWSRAITPEMHGLRFVRYPSLPQLFAATRPWRIERIDSHLDDPEQFRQLLGNPLLPALRELAIGHWAKPSWFDDLSGSPPHLELSIDLAHVDRPRFVAKAEASPVQTLMFKHDRRYRARYSRDAAGKLSRLDMELAVTLPNLDILPRPLLAEIDGTLRSLGFASLSHFEVTMLVGGMRTVITHLFEQGTRVVRR